MSFLAPDRIPFSIVTQNPTPESLEDAVNNFWLQLPSTTNAVDGGVYTNPTGLVVVGPDVNSSTINSFNGVPADVLVNGDGTSVFLTGPSNVQGTNLYGGGLVIEIVPGNDPDSVQTIAFSCDYNILNTLVDLSELVGGNLTYDDLQTIAQAAGGQGGDFVYYAHGTGGDDLLIGSDCSDFLRGGDGNDSISAQGGNDLVRGGAGSDQIFLGEGFDSVYYTIDQLSFDGDRDLIEDFTSGIDQITFDASLDLEITGFGTNTLTVTTNGITTSIVSGNDAFSETDIDDQIDFIV
jgi:Ca2+-binding RTX toxin-like protein